MITELTQRERDQRIVDGAPLVFSVELRLALDALLRWAAEFEPDAWPSVPSAIRFAKFYGVDAQELAALCGIISFRLTPKGKVIWCDSQRYPELVRRTSPGRLNRRVLRAYGYFVAVAELARCNRAAVH